jgi:hypothetical protein
MQIFSKLFAMTLFCGLILQSGIKSATAQSPSQKQWQNERPPACRFPRMPRDGPAPFLSASRAEITKRTAPAARDSNTTLIGSWIGGGCAAAAVSGTHAYFGGGRNFIIADVSDSGNPAELGRILLPSGPNNLTVNGNLAYVAAFDAGLRIIDVTNPANPIEAGFFDTGLAVDVTVSGNYAYVASGGDGLRIIDVSNPANPIQVGSYGSRGFANGVAVSGIHAYVTEATEGLRIIDVSNPANPTQVGFFDTVEGTVFPILDQAYDVAISGNFAYVVDQRDGVRIINVSDPANPTEVGFFDNATSAIISVAVSGDFIYGSDERGGLRIIFVANLASLVEVGFVDTGGVSWNVAVASNMAYVADGFGMRIIDVSNFASPEAVGFFETGDMPFGITVSGDYAYLAAGLVGLQIFDVSNPKNPTFVSSFSYDGCLACGQDVAVIGDLAYFVGAVGLRIIDVSNPAEPAEIGAILTQGFPLAVAVSGNYAYLAAGNGGLRIIDISSPQSPIEVGFFANAFAQEVVVRGNLVYVAGSDAGLRIIDVTDRANPVEVGFLDTEGFAIGVAVNGNYAYLAEPPHPAFPQAVPGLRIIDVSNPRSPTEIGFFVSDGFPLRVVVSGDYAYVADPSKGLCIIDVSNPQSPVKAGFYESAGGVIDVHVNADTACLAIDELYIIRNDVKTAVASPSDRTPERFHLRQNYPNPLRASVSNSGTTITFTLSKAANVTLEVYNMLGEKVTTLVKGAKPAGEHVVSFEASSLPSGIYFYTLTAGELKQTRKMVIIGH